MKRRGHAALVHPTAPLVALSLVAADRPAPQLPITPNPNPCPRETRDVVALAQRAIPAVTPVSSRRDTAVSASSAADGAGPTAASVIAPSRLPG